MSIEIRRVTRNGLEVLELETAASACAIALHGAQVLSFVPRGGPDLLWLSDRASWSVGKALRGGIPLCFPWFGPHPTERGYPAHGFARTRLWRLAEAGEAPGGVARARFELVRDAASDALYPHPFSARLTVTAGERLELAFEVAHTGPAGSAPLSYELAFHTYLAVSEVEAIAIEGLSGSAFVDKVAGGARLSQGGGPLHLAGEVDRVYAGAGRLQLVDPAASQPLAIESAGAASTVIWTPGPAKARALGDIDPDGFHGFVCIETGNIAAGRIELAPGAGHTTTVRYARGSDVSAATRS